MARVRKLFLAKKGYFPAIFVFIFLQFSGSDPAWGNFFHISGLVCIRQEKRAQRLTFWVRRPPGRMGVFHAKGWGSKTSRPPSKVCLPWVSKRGIWDIPKILPGCPGPLGVVQKVCAKKVVLIFRSLLKAFSTIKRALGSPYGGLRSGHRFPLIV